jgi:uncharacterized protein YjbJ (UPF0337 family)
MMALVEMSGRGGAHQGAGKGVSGEIARNTDSNARTMFRFRAAVHIGRMRARPAKPRRCKPPLGKGRAAFFCSNGTNARPSPYIPQGAVRCPAGNGRVVALRSLPPGQGPGNKCAATMARAGKRRRRMNWDQIEGKWKQLGGKAKEQWGKLTDDDLDIMAGKRDQMVGKVQEKYGIAKEEAERQVDEWSARN